MHNPNLLILKGQAYEYNFYIFKQFISAGVFFLSLFDIIWSLKTWTQKKTSVELSKWRQGIKFKGYHCLIFNSNCSEIITLSTHLSSKILKMDGGGVGRSYTNLFPGPMWNYNKIVEKSGWIANRTLAREKLYHRKTGRENTGSVRGLSGLSWAAAAVPEGWYFSGWAVLPEKDRV